MSSQGSQGSLTYRRRPRHLVASVGDEKQPANSSDMPQEAVARGNSSMSSLSRYGESLVKKNHRPSWVDRTLSSRGRRSSVLASDTFSFSVTQPDALQQNEDRAQQGLFSPNAHRKKRIAAPANFVQEQKAYFAEVDAFELEEESPTCKEKETRSFKALDSAVPHIQAFPSRHALEVVLESTSEDMLHQKPKDGYSTNRRSLAGILQTPHACDKDVAEGLTRSFSYSESVGSGGLLHCSDPEGEAYSSLKVLGKTEESEEGHTVQRPSVAQKADGLLDVGLVVETLEALQIQDKISKINEVEIVVIDSSDEEEAKGKAGNQDIEHETQPNLDQGEDNTQLGITVQRDHMVEGFKGLHIGELKEFISQEGNAFLKIIGEDEEEANESQPDEKFVSPKKSSHMIPAFDALLNECGQTTPLSLGETISQFCDIQDIVKIGEGTYGEAFRGNGSVFKIVPMDGDFQINGETQKTCEEMYTEALLTFTLNKLRGTVSKSGTQLDVCNNFIETIAVKVCRGAYDPGLVRAWEDWDAERISENDHPMIFPEKQLYVLFVLADGGKDLESFVLTSFDEARSLLMQVTMALAIAEEACEFEHRDLHWGNILIARKKECESHCKLRGKDMRIRTFGIFVHIIDFTLARLHTGKQVLFCNLSADPALFEGPKGDVQAETYRRMLTLTKGRWDKRFFKTNCFWLHYVSDILLSKKAFRCSLKEKRALRAFRSRVLLYDSAEAAVHDSMFDGLWVEQFGQEEAT